jgi:hypothetical protein
VANARRRKKVEPTGSDDALRELKLYLPNNVYDMVSLVASQTECSPMEVMTTAISEFVAENEPSRGRQHMVMATPDLVFGVSFDEMTIDIQSANRLIVAARALQLAVNAMMQNEESYTPRDVSAAHDGVAIVLSLAIAMSDDLAGIVSARTINAARERAAAK